jgi:type VI protein secretion system component Hcp
MPLLLEIPGISGKSPYEGHETWMVLDSVAWHAKRNVAYSTGGSYGVGGVASRPLFSEVKVTRKSDSVTAIVWQNCIQNASFTAKLHWLRTTAGGKADVFAELILTGARIISISDNSAGNRPTETIAFSFSEFELVYTGYGHDLSGVQASVSYSLPT